MPNRKSTRRAKVVAPNPVEEWNFNGCPDDELACCCYYEYARMDNKIRAQVAHLRASGHWGLGLYPGDADYYPDAWFRNFFRRLPEFPDVAWLKIDQHKRRAARLACERIEGPFVSVDPNRYFNEEEQYPYYPLDVGTFGLRSVHAVEIDWTASDEAILTAFAKWRDANRPSHAVILESRGRGGARELLKFLGAYRLMRSFENDSVGAADWVAERGPEPVKGKKTDMVPRYGDESAWRKAAGKAKRIITKGIGLSPAGMLEGKLKATNLPVVQQARLAVAIAQAKKADRGRAKLEAAERLLDNENKIVRRSTKPGD